MKEEKYIEITDYIRETIKNSNWRNNVFAVGGCVRDCIMGNEIKDIDLVVSLPNGGIKFAVWLYDRGLLVREPIVYEHFGTAMFRFKEFPEQEIEAVQTRKEAYRDMESRNPETAYGTLEDDCHRRDFTINALYYDISNDLVIDFNKRGVEDIHNRVIRTCGDPEIIFTEDPLRICRMCRFASRLGFTIDKDTWEGAWDNVYRLSIISKERINDEFTKMIVNDDFEKVKDALCYLWDLCAFRYIIPSLYMMSFREQYNLLKKIEKFYENIKLGFPMPTDENLGTMVERFLPTKTLMLALMLFNSPDAETELRELKCSNEEIDKVLFLIKTNKWYFEDKEDEQTRFLKLMHKCKSPVVLRKVLLIGDKEYPFTFSHCTIENNHFSFYEYELPVSGDDVMEIKGIGPSKEVKRYLDALWEFVYANPNKKDKKTLIEQLKIINRI